MGNEFSSVEALWSQFENVMAKEEPEEGGAAKSEDRQEGQEEADRVKVEGSE